MRPLTTLVLLCASSTALAGCFLWTTRGEGNDLKQTSATLDTRVESLEKGVETDRERLRVGAERAEQQVAKLESIIDNAKQVVARNSADLGQDVQALRTELGRLEGQIAELRNGMELTKRAVDDHKQETTERLEKLARGAGIEMPLDNAEVPADKGEHFTTAQRAYQAGEYARARALYREYLRRYATDEQADNAQYAIGASYMQEHQPARALGEFHKVLERFSTGDVVDDTLFALGEAFFEMHVCTDAKAALDALIQNHPSSPLVPRARAKLRDIRQAPRNHCTS